jgi:hypothetical protein
VTNHRPKHINDSPEISAAAGMLQTVLGTRPERWLMVNVEAQSLVLIESELIIRTYGVSTAAAGVNGAAGSFGTPPGVHQIGRKIGMDEPVGTWFQSREPVGQWPGDGVEGEDLILSRILTLVGCEQGVNLGPGCDSEERFIYIHGTNHEGRIGEPVSHGCVRMSNADVIRLFEEVEKGDPVVII